MDRCSGAGINRAVCKDHTLLIPRTALSWHASFWACLHMVLPSPGLALAWSFTLFFLRSPQLAFCCLCSHLCMPSPIRTRRGQGQLEGRKGKGRPSRGQNQLRAGPERAGSVEGRPRRAQACTLLGLLSPGPALSGPPLTWPCPLQGQPSPGHSLPCA